ncbi:MAG: hypothetical protein ACTHJ4_04135, partial [Candidatus Nucleicultricaceae bacterium]
SIETYIDLFIEGIYLAGAPTGDTCSVHESLFDEPASFYTHDLLHLQGLAPSTDERENKEHVNKMREVASVLWANIKKHTKQSKEYKEGKAALFALLHELSQYNTSKLLKATMTIQEAFSVMMQNARDNVTGIFLGDTVVDSDSYYRAVLLKNASFNRDASLNNLSPEIAVVETPEDILSQHAFIITYKLGDFEGHYTSDDHLSKYENARKFAFPIACLLKGPGRYQNLTMDNFTLGAGHQKFTEFLNEFQKTYGTLNH